LAGIAYGLESGGVRMPIKVKIANNQEEGVVVVRVRRPSWQQFIHY